MVEEAAVRSPSAGGRPRLLIEEWLPIEELGVECGREGSVGNHPPINRLHVWWARRPLVLSRAAVLGSILPSDFPRDVFLRLLGILGDPVAEKRRMGEAKARGIRLKEGFSYDRAFTNPIAKADLDRMRAALSAAWGTSSPVVLDSFAGGGSIPFEAIRLGLTVIANELNPVASVILRATLDFPLRYGAKLAGEIEKWGGKVEERLRKSLGECFPKRPGEEIFGYIWVRTVKCPECGLMVPLSPNWWLDRDGKLGFKPELPKDGSNTCTFRIARDGEDGFRADEGSVKGGRALCPRGHVIEEDYIKAEARAGRMGHQLAAVIYKIRGKSGRYFREATDVDLAGVRRAEEILREKLPLWEAKGWVPTEGIPEGSKTAEPRRSGILRWSDFFNPRQLLVHLTTLEAIKELPLEEELDPETARAVRTYLALAFDKALNYNSLQSRLDVSRAIIKGTFDRHDFAFIWSYGEINGASGTGQLWRWALDQVLDAYRGLVALLGPREGRGLAPVSEVPSPPSPTILFGDASSLSSIPDGSIHAAVVDPPYSDNVMYAELSDYFYVWLKRLLGDVYPELFRSRLTDKDREAVANVARFRGFRERRRLAQEDYEAKMLAAFRELHRVLRDDGVLTVMFTHKSNDAWSALGRSLIEAGFEVTASWPVHTESEHSLHQAGKIAAGSTILLVCRKRKPAPATRGWWEEVRPIVYRAAYSRAEELSRQGIGGIDLQIATYGAALQVISSRWPVVDTSGKEVPIIRAIEEASRAASEFRMSQLISPEHLAGAKLDVPTMFYVIALDTFQGRTMPTDEAVKLSHALNVDVDDLLGRYGILRKEGGKKSKQVTMILLTAEERRRAGKFDVNGRFSGSILLDRIHAAEVVYEDKGARGVNELYREHGFMDDPAYLAAFEALLNALPPDDPEYRILSEIARYAMKGRVRDRRPEPEKMNNIEEYFDLR
ncbi:MAG: DUF1156 domain-containing protein [Conexivisphaera sp.]